MVGGSFTFYAYYDRRGGWVYSDPPDSKEWRGLDSYFKRFTDAWGGSNKRVNFMRNNELYKLIYIYCTYLRRMWTLLSFAISFNHQKDHRHVISSFVSCGQYNLHLLLLGGTGGSIHSCIVVVVVVGRCRRGVGGCRRTITI